ncbi:MAG TPA: hypothetical protein QF641_04695 [Candidatus Thalassarchaeaceae archaeon]|jgi:hypothetical protein|nr:hypothetical protein [Candidatus Thalassarchaeaceae archaeon]|tara:strand:+ start:23632 stop:23931 length:300 start_codon:yes stop_codon:yes gene_type:complete
MECGVCGFSFDEADHCPACGAEPISQSDNADEEPVETQVVSDKELIEISTVPENGEPTPVIQEKIEFQQGPLLFGIEDAPIGKPRLQIPFGLSHAPDSE